MENNKKKLTLTIIAIVTLFLIVGISYAFFEAQFGDSSNDNVELLKEENKTLLADYIKGLYTKQGVNGLYLHDESLENGAGDGSLRYAGADYVLTDKALGYDNMYDYDETSNGLIKYNCGYGINFSYVGFNCSSSNASYYYLAYDNSKKQYSTLFEITNAAIKEGYIKENMSNYVCFGSDAEICPNDNLYRIIGVFGNQVKLIKADYATKELLGEDGDYSNNTTSQKIYKESQTTIAKYYWNYKNDTTQTSGSSNWSTSLLNKINLNTNYLNNIGNKWKNKIATTTWNLGGLNYYAVTAKQAYDLERGSSVYEENPSTYKAKVGLMYPSDYGFAATPDNWTKTLYDYSKTNIRDNNWMYLGETEWMISPFSSGDIILYIYMFGNIDFNNANIGYGVRPIIYLESSVALIGGEGTRSLPYRVN